MLISVRILETFKMSQRSNELTKNSQHAYEPDPSRRSNFKPFPKRKPRPAESESRKQFQTKRFEDKIKTKGAETMKKDTERLKSELFVGINEEEALAKIAETQSLRAQMLSITTRGIGTSVCHLVFISSTYHHQIAVPSIYSLFRVFLAVLESKLETIKGNYPLVARNIDAIYPYEVDATILRICQKVTVAPEPLRRINDYNFN